MAPVIHLDTHVVAWLYDGGAAGLSDGAAEALAGAHDVHCSPMVRLELTYLHEIGRLSVPALEVCDALAGAIGLRFSDAPFFAVVREAERQTWTRDPFDRVIVAQAVLDSAPLLTKDETIHRAYDAAIW